MRSIGRFLLACLAPGLVLTACARPDGGSDPGGAPVSEPGDGIELILPTNQPDAQFEGALELGSLQVDAGCVTFEAAVGQERALVVWPDGTKALGSQSVELPDGSTLTFPLSSVALGGGFSQADQADQAEVASSELRQCLGRVSVPLIFVHSGYVEHSD